MKKALVWGLGKCFPKQIYTIKYHEMLNHFTVVGVTSNSYIYEEVYGYKFIPKNELKCIEFDFVVVMANGRVFKEILNEALELGVAKECIINYEVLSLPGFELDKYIQLKKNPPSIFANNCWGGITYHSLGLEFTSPTINMFESVTDYLKLVKDLRRYMNEELEFVTTRYEKTQGFDYPVVRCGDIIFHFNHYKSFEEGKLCWERRKERINWDNLFIMMYTKEPDLADEFTKLPYEKKVCFVPFPSEDKSLVCVDFCNSDDMKNQSFSTIVNGMAMGTYQYYDMFDLVAKAEFTKLVKVHK